MSMAWDTMVQCQVELYQRLKKMVLGASLLNTQHYKVRIKGMWSNPRKGVAPSTSPSCSSYGKGRLQVTLDYSWPTTTVYNSCGDLGINNKTPNRMLTRRLSHAKCINASLCIGSTHPSSQKSEKKKNNKN